MLFNTFSFLMFFTVILFIYLLMPPRWRWALLLVASYYFYISWGSQWVIWLLATTSISYLCGRRIAGNDNNTRRRLYLALGILGCLSFLFQLVIH